MKAVKLLVNTAYQGPRKEGDVINVPDDFAARWVKNKIAVLVDAVEEAPVEEEIIEETIEEEVEEVIEEAVKDIAEMSAKELYELCQEKGIEVEAKKKKEYYLEKLA